MLRQIIAVLGITSPIIVIISTGIYFILRKVISDKFDVIKERQIEEIKYSIAKGMQIFEKEKEALTAVLASVSQMIIYVGTLFSFQDEEYSLIEEKKCDEFELGLANYILYLDDISFECIELIQKILRRNSTWIIDAVGHNEFRFDSNDIELLKYLYQELTRSFKDQLFAKRKNNYDIKIIKISFMLRKFVEDKILSKSEVAEYIYNEYPINLVISRIKDRKEIIIELFNKVLKTFEEREMQSNYRYNQTLELQQLIKYLT